jgi:hypothetical protein
MKTYGEWRYTSTILKLGIRWMTVVSFTPQSLYSRGNSPGYPLYRKMGKPQSWSGRCGEDKILIP